MAARFLLKPRQVPGRRKIATRRDSPALASDARSSHLMHRLRNSAGQQASMGNRSANAIRGPPAPAAAPGPAEAEVTHGDRRWQYPAHANRRVFAPDAIRGG